MLAFDARGKRIENNANASSIGNSYRPTHITLYIIKDSTHIYAGATFRPNDQAPSQYLKRSGPCRQLARLIAQRIADTRTHQQLLTTKVLSWDGPNGIDDAVRANVNLSTLTILQWQATLRDRPLAEVTNFWDEIGFTP